jgi:hypothetical protein
MPPPPSTNVTIYSYSQAIEGYTTWHESWLVLSNIFVQVEELIAQPNTSQYSPGAMSGVSTTSSFSNPSPIINNDWDNNEFLPVSGDLYFAIACLTANLSGIDTASTFTDHVLQQISEDVLMTLPNLFLYILRNASETYEYIGKGNAMFLSNDAVGIAMFLQPNNYTYDAFAHFT